VTVVVAKDSTHYTVTDTLRLNISREVLSNYALTTDSKFVAGTKLPKGQTLPLIHKATKVVGACSATGTTLKALAATGKCTVTIGAWETPSRSYLAKTFVVQLAPNPQTWVPPTSRPPLGKKASSASWATATSLKPQR
jgi:hypothetical protein